MKKGLSSINIIPKRDHFRTRAKTRLSYTKKDVSEELGVVKSDIVQE